jgi:hypothetical protein
LTAASLPVYDEEKARLLSFKDAPEGIPSGASLHNSFYNKNI